MTSKAPIIALLFTLLMPLRAGAGLSLVSQETVPAGSGVKSVLVHPGGSRVYAINLEGMSVHEFDRASRKLLRKLVFVPHKGAGFDYKNKEAIESYEEKPVEGHFTHGGRYLWISLHNAGGIVAWDLEDGGTYVEGAPFKEASVRTYGTDSGSRPLRLLFIETGKTPKVITSSPDGKRLFVANWHSNSVSFIDIESSEPARWKLLREVWASIPRGMAVSPDSEKLYIAEMGGSTVAVTTVEGYTKPGRIKLGLNPRHILMHEGVMYASLNISSRIAAMDMQSGGVRHADTCKAPRTIAIAPGAEVLFSVCYKDEMLQAFSLPGLEPLGQWASTLAPVGVDVFEDSSNALVEAWVANYRSGTLSVFTFRSHRDNEQPAAPAFGNSASR